MRQQLLTILILSVIFSLASSKVVEGSIALSSFNKESWKYIAKFGYNYGNGDYTIKMRFSQGFDAKLNHFRIPLHVHVDDFWPEALAAQSCSEKNSQAKAEISVVLQSNAEWSVVYSGQVSQHRRPHVWFFSISDCEKQLTSEEIPANMKLDYEIHMTNSDGSEFSVEEQGFGLPYGAIMLYMIGFLLFNLNRLRLLYAKEEEMDYAFVFLIAAIAIEIFAIGCELAHIMAYSIDGRGIFLMNLLSQICSIISQFIMTCLLVLIAWGWTISFQALKEWYCYIPIGLMVGALQISMIALSHLFSDDISTKYHEYDNWAGLLIVMIRVGLFGYFSNGIRETSSKSCDNVRSFTRKFGFLGSCYLLGFPLLVLLTMFVRPYIRHRIITIGTIVAQTIGMAMLAYSFSSKKSEYASISLRSRSSFLPSAKFDKLD